MSESSNFEGDFFMAQIISNQASLNYEYNGQNASVLSNIATATLGEAISVEKVSLNDTYRLGDEITYSVSFLNSSGSTLTNVSIIDDLGAYRVGNTSAVPLTYVAPAILFIDGVFSGNITPSVGTGIIFTVPSLASGSRAQIIYRAAVNNYAPIGEEGAVTNTVTVRADGLTGSVSDSDTITVDSYADVTVTKTMSPQNVLDGDAITYTFVINNYGNAPVTNIVLRDAFDPAPENISVQVNGVAVSADDYSYEGGVLTFPADSSDFELSLPAANINTDPESGLVTVTPSTVTVSVVGII